VSAAPRRRRALAFGALAVCCALASAAFAARYRDGAERSYGEPRAVVAVQRDLAAGTTLTAGQVERALAVREVPERFVPPDALPAPEVAVGARLRADVPAGSYLLGSQLGDPGAAGRRRRGLPRGLRPIEVGVASAGSLAAAGGAGRRVDVVAADEPGTTSNPRVRVLARRVPLLGLRRERGDGAGGAGWKATLGLDRPAALAVIEAENFAREVRLLPR
jgi:Flp pilus assembly protein CpaB